MKYSDARPALANMARGTLRLGSTVSPTWQAACSNAGAAKPIRYSPAMTLVSSPNQPANGTVRWNVKACCQSTPPSRIGTTAERNASAADAVAIGIARRITHFTPHRLITVKNTTMVAAIQGTGIDGRYHWLMADLMARATYPW